MSTPCHESVGICCSRPCIYRMTMAATMFVDIYKVHSCCRYLSFRSSNHMNEEPEAPKDPA